MEYELLLVSDANGVRTITLNRPAALNALTTDLHRELSDALRQAERDSDVRALVITGAGRAFCAGQDLKELGDLPPPGEPTELGAWLRARYNPLIVRLRGLEKPVIGAVNGIAAGAGMSLALACDLRVASESATFSCAFNRVGLVPDSGSTHFLPHLIGIGRALELAWTGRAVDAREAQALGLVNRVVPAEQALAAAQQLATELAAGALKALALTKRAMYRALSSDLETMLDYEAGLQEVAARSADFREGVAAFKEKRPPRFSGG